MDISNSTPLLYCGHMRMTEDSHYFSEEEDDTPQAPYPHVDRSSYAAMTLCTCKVDDNSLSILTHQTVAMPGDLGLSHL
jgi:hypothetical protein